MDVFPASRCSEFQTAGTGPHGRLNQNDAHETVRDEGHGDEQRRYDAVDGDRLAAAVQHERFDAVAARTTHVAQQRHVVRRTGDQSRRIIQKVLVIVVIFIHSKSVTIDTG